MGQDECSWKKVRNKLGKQCSSAARNSRGSSDSICQNFPVTAISQRESWDEAFREEDNTVRPTQQSARHVELF